MYFIKWGLHLEPKLFNQLIKVMKKFIENSSVQLESATSLNSNLD